MLWQIFDKVGDISCRKEYMGATTTSSINSAPIFRPAAHVFGFLTVFISNSVICELFLGGMYGMMRLRLKARPNQPAS